MNWHALLNNSIIEILGWTLLHSLWQIALVALVLFAVLQFLHRFSARARYTAAVFALVLATLLPVVTFVQLSRSARSISLQTANWQADSGGQIPNDLRRAEDFSNSGKLKIETAQANNKNSPGTIENLQNFFNENLAALLPFVVGLWLAGVAFFGVRLAGGVWQLHLYKTREI